MKKTPAIIKAAKHGNMKRVESCLAAGDDIDARDEDGYTALMWACEKGREPVVHVLLQNDACVNVLSEWGESPLTLAAKSRHGDIVRQLLARGADPDEVPKHAPPPLAAAAAHNDWALCEQLLASGATINLLHEWGSALSAAADHENETLACQLIERGADVDCPPRGKYAPVVVAARAGLLRLLDLILARTRHNLADEIFTHAVAEAAGDGREDVVDFLLTRGCLPDLARHQAVEEELIFPLYAATAQRHTGVVASLLAHGANASASAPVGSALTAAAQSGYLEIVDLLLAHGADVTQVDIFRRTALGWALSKEWSGTAESLLDAGALPSTAERDATLLLIVRSGNAEHARRLLDAGASPQAAFTRNGLPLAENQSREDLRRRLNEIFGDDEDAGGDERAGTTALMLAAEGGSLPLVELLLARGAKPEALNMQGESALIFAAGSGSLDVVSRLLAAGVRADTRSKDGWSAMLAAAETAPPEMLDLLHRHGGDVRQGDQDDWTPLLAALRNNRPDSARRLIELGADFRQPCGDGFTSLMAAARGECLAFLEPLVSGGVDVNARWTETDQDALMIAAKEGSLAVMEKLLALGADPLAINRDGESACTLARQAGHEAICALLSALGADPGKSAVLKSRPDPEACRRLVTQLQSCLPEFDAWPLLKQLPETDDEVLWWLSEPLTAENLWAYAEWKDYWGDLPELRMLDEIDMAAYEPEKLINLLEKHGYPSWPEEIPYFEYQNHFLKQHGWRMLTLAEENIHMFCVRDDAAGIAKLVECLGELKLRLVDYPPLTLRQCAKAIKEAADSRSI